MSLSRFWVLCKNEHLKLFSRVSTWVLLGIVLILVLGLGGCQKLMDTSINNAIASADDEDYDLWPAEDIDWRSELLSGLANVKAIQKEPFDELGNRYRTEAELRELEAATTLIQRHLDTNTPPQGMLSSFAATTPFEFIDNSLMLSGLISIFLIVLGVTAVAGEFTQGSIKFLLISPYRRWKILTSKFCTMLVIAAMMLVLLLASSFLVGFIFWGRNAVPQSYIFGVGTRVYEMNAYLYILLKYALTFVSLVMTILLTFACATLLRNTAGAIAVAFAVTWGASLIGSFGQLLGGGEFVKYLLPVQQDLSGHIWSYSNLSSLVYNDMPMLPIGLTGSPLGLPGYSFTFSVGVLAVYAVCLTWISLDSFSRRDVK